MDIAVSKSFESCHPQLEAYVDDAAGATMAHAYLWPSVISQGLGHEDRSLIAKLGGEICGVLPMMLLRHWLFGTFHVSLPWLDYGGIIAGDPTVAHDLLEAAILQAREDKASWIELRSMKKLRPDMPTRDDKVTFELELGPPESVWSRLDAKVRNQVRKAQKADLTCHFGREELLPEFYRIFARNMRDLGTPVWGMGFFQVILAAFEKTSEIAVVQKGNYGIAAGLTIGFKDTLAMPSASALRGFRSLCPNNLLYWEVIKRACETGYRCFDFGRSTIGSGTYNFKKHWGPTIKPLHWQYVLLNGNKIPQLNPSNPKFRLAVAIWKRLPLALATWLGPRIARHLP